MHQYSLRPHSFPYHRAEGKAPGLPGFWLTALSNGRRTGETIEEHDRAALESLTNLTLETLEDFEVSLGSYRPPPSSTTCTHCPRALPDEAAKF